MKVRIVIWNDDPSKRSDTLRIKRVLEFTPNYRKNGDPDSTTGAMAKEVFGHAGFVTVEKITE